MKDFIDRTIHEDAARGLKLIVETYYDQDCPSPLEYDEGVRIVILHRRYSDPANGECGRDGDEVMQWAADNATDWFVAPLFMFDHSGISLSTRDFGDRWDSGQVGIIALKRSEFGTADATTPEAVNAKLAKYASDIAENYGQWINGECYGYTIALPADEDEDGEELDACWGYVGHEAVEAGINEALTWCFNDAAKRRDEALQAAAEAVEASRPDMYPTA